MYSHFWISWLFQISRQCYMYMYCTLYMLAWQRVWTLLLQFVLFIGEKQVLVNCARNLQLLKKFYWSNTCPLHQSGCSLSLKTAIQNSSIHLTLCQTSLYMYMEASLMLHYMYNKRSLCCCILMHIGVCNFGYNRGNNMYWIVGTFEKFWGNNMKE